MNKSIFILALLCSIAFISNQEAKETEKPAEETVEANTENENSEDASGKTINFDDMMKMTQSEKDKLLACIEIISNKLKKDAAIVQSTIQILSGKVQGDIATQKITADMVNKCYYTIDENSVKTLINNGTLMETEIDDELLSFATLDYSAYKDLNPNDFQLTAETQILFMKLDKARNDFISENKEKQEKQRNEFHLFGISLKTIPAKLNLLFFLIIFGAFIGGVLYLLKGLMKNEKKAARKKEKNN